MKFWLSFLAIQGAVPLCTGTIMQNDPLVIGLDDAVSALYNMIAMDDVRLHVSTFKF